MDDELLRALQTASAEAGMDPALLLAVSIVETGAVAFVAVDGRREPMIRFEGHLFDRQLSPADRAEARAAGLASSVPGRVANPASQAKRWTVLRRAASIDSLAAYGATSWGLGQVLGKHWQRLGYESIEDLVEEARGSAAGQFRLMTRYIECFGLAPMLTQRNWEGFARGYNGTAYRRNAYHLRLEEAYRQARQRLAAAPTARSPQRVSDNAIRDVQLALTALGYAVEADGLNGPVMRAAVIRFQQERGLPADGIAGPVTRSELDAALKDTGGWRSLWRALLRLVRLS